MPLGVKSLIIDVLQRTVGEFIVGLDQDNLKVGVTSGEIVLTDLGLNTAALRASPAPSTMRSARVESLRVEIPWVALSSKPVRIEIVGVQARSRARPRRSRPALSRRRRRPRATARARSPRAAPGSPRSAAVHREPRRGRRRAAAAAAAAAAARGGGAAPAGRTTTDTSSSPRRSSRTSRSPCATACRCASRRTRARRGGAVRARRDARRVPRATCRPER